MNLIYRILSGFWQVHFISLQGERLLNFLRKQGVSLWGIQRTKDGFFFFISLRDEKLLSEFSLSEGEELRKVRRGFPAVVYLFRRRIAFFAGIALLILSLFWSSGLVWSVDVVGNETVSDRTVREAFEELGLTPGVRKKKLDAGELALRFQIAHPEFSFASVNFIGTRAKVEVREKETVPSLEEQQNLCSNLVASKAARIVRYEILGGQVQVKVGDVVPQGALLVSGITESKKGTFSMVRARGRVFGETETLWEETISLEEKEKVLTGKERTRKTAYLLGIAIPLTPFTSKAEPTEKVLVNEEPLTLFGRELPIIIKEEIFLETTEKSTRITVDRARDLAYDKYNRYIREHIGSDGEILEEEISFSQEKDFVRMTVFLRAVENVAEEKSVKLTELS